MVTICDIDSRWLTHLIPLFFLKVWHITTPSENVRMRQSFHNSLILHRPLLGFTVVCKKNAAPSFSNRWSTVGSSASWQLAWPNFHTRRTKSATTRVLESRHLGVGVERSWQQAQQVLAQVLLHTHWPREPPVARGEKERSIIYSLISDSLTVHDTLYIAMLVWHMISMQRRIGALPLLEMRHISQVVFLLLEHCQKVAGRESRDVYTNRQSEVGFNATVSRKRVAVALGALVFLRPLHSQGLENRGAKVMAV